MKKLRKQDIRKVEAALIHSHRKRPVPEVSEHWHRKVMAHVLEEAGPAVRAQENGMKLGLAAWRLAAVSFLMALVLAAYAMDGVASHSCELADVILWETSGYDLAQAFGIL